MFFCANQILSTMEQVFLSLTKSDFQELLASTVNSCLKQIPELPPSTTPQDELLTVPQAAEFLSLSVPTIYGLLHKGSIPSMKQGKRVYFSKQELLAWLKDGRKNTLIELGKEADVFLETLKIKRG